MRKTFKRGFTIVELVIVIAVIAILAAVLIPTFSSLIKKANMSADMQIVQQMNVILSADEAVDGKPAQVAEAKDILEENGITDFTPLDSNNVYYWTGADNRVMLWEKNEEDPATGAVTYPNDLKKKYKTVTTPSNDWADLAGEYAIQVVTPAEGQTLRAALLETVQNSEDKAILQLPKNEILDLGAGGLYFLGNYMTMNGGTGKDITIDLNGGTLVSKTPHSNGYYYDLTVPTNGTLELVNGKIDIAMDDTPGGAYTAIGVETGGHLILRDVEYTADCSGIYPSGDAAEVVIEDCVINCAGPYVIATNNRFSDNIRIDVSNSELKADSCAVLVNVPSDVHITDCELEGSGWGLFLRSGHAVVENTTIKTTDGDTGPVGTGKSHSPGLNTSCEYFNYNQSAADIPYWGSGCQIPYAPLVIGDYSKHDAYNHDTDCQLINVKLVSANTENVPDVILAARSIGKDVVFNYDDASTVGKTVVYGTGYVREAVDHTFVHSGTIVVNGEAKSVE